LNGWWGFPFLCGDGAVQRPDLPRTKPLVLWYIGGELEPLPVRQSVALARPAALRCERKTVQQQLIFPAAAITRI
jgi:hypothetical protein